MPPLTYISSGTNLGDREKHLIEARVLIENTCGTITERSSVYETEPWGPKNQPWFLNEVLVLESGLSPAYLLRELLEIEKICGRKQRTKWKEREIDLDILFFGDQHIDEKGLKIPHPRIQERKFNLVPLAELNPGLIHPVSGMTVQQLLADCNDTLQVIPY